MILNKTKAQALTELTLFGSFFIMLLAVMVSYSMRYNSQQRVNQEAFRKGISKLHHYEYPHDDRERGRVGNKYPIDASGTSSLTYLRYRDDYVPDPSNPFGLSSVESSVSSAALTRDYRMHMSAGEDYELPQIAVDIDGINKPDENGDIPCNSHLNEKYRDSKDADLQAKYGTEDSPCYYLAAGFRVDEGVSRDKNTFTRYAQIYGEGSLLGCKGSYDRDEDNCSGGWKPLYTWDDDDGEWEVNSSLPKSFALKMIDSSGGEIMEYGAAVAQCRRIVDDTDQHSDVKDTVCYQECSEGQSSDTACGKICKEDVIVPWYCEGYEEINDENHLYKFPVLNGLFGISASHNYEDKGNPKPIRTIGVQTNYDQQSAKDGTASYSAKEDSASVENQVNLSSGWIDTIKRRVIFLPYKPNRDSGDEDDLETGNIDNQKSPDISSFTWETAR